MERSTHWIDGEEWSADPERTGPVYDPATGQVAGEVAMASVAEVDAAVEAARKAFEEWRDVPVTRRQNVMFEFRRIVSDRRRQLAEVITSAERQTLPLSLGHV